MKLKTEHVCTLDQLNEDCMLNIFSQLNLCEQFGVLQLNHYFKDVILRLWERKYRRVGIDFRQQPELKLLSRAELAELMPLLASRTRALLHIDELLCCDLFQNKTFENVLQISAKSPNLPNLHETFPSLESLHLRQSAITFKKLTRLDSLMDLQLIHCTPESNSDLELIFRNLRLKSFSLIPPTEVVSEIFRPYFKSITHCSTLQTLALNVADVAATLSEITGLPQLQRLTAFTVTNDDGDAPMTLPVAIVEALAANPDTAQRIVAARLKCLFDARLLAQLQRLPELRSFAWHSHLLLEFVNAEGSVCWYFYKPETKLRSVLRFINVLLCRGLDMLDLRWNSEVSSDFVVNLLNARRQLMGETRKETDLLMCDCIGDVSSDDITDFEKCKQEMKSAVYNLGYFELDFSNDFLKVNNSLNS